MQRSATCLHKHTIIRFDKLNHNSCHWVSSTILLTLKWKVMCILLFTYLSSTTKKEKKNHILFVMSTGFPLFFSNNNVITFRKIERQC